MTSLPLNATAIARMTVADSDLASALDSGDGPAFPAVLSTPRMIALMELAAARLLAPLLEPDELSVGVSLEIEHTAPTPPGAEVTATARYVGRDGKQFVIRVSAADAAGEIGRGAHKRAIVAAERIAAAAAQRVRI